MLKRINVDGADELLILSKFDFRDPESLSHPPYKYHNSNNIIYTPWTVGSLLSNQINLNNFGLKVTKVTGLIQENRTLDNLNKITSIGDICALISRQDTAVNALVNWIDYNKTFMKKVANTEINYLSFTFTDEYNNLLYELNDWLITMTRTIRKKQYQQ